MYFVDFILKTSKNELKQIASIDLQLAMLFWSVHGSAKRYLNSFSVHFSI